MTARPACRPGHQLRAAVTAVLAAGLLLPLALSSPASALTATRATALAAAPDRNLSWLSTGDSFSSGEGISAAGVGADYCAQSLLAYGPRARQLLIDQRGWKIPTHPFSACTGHLVGDFYNEHRNDKLQGSGKGSLWKWTQDQAGKNATFDVATFSFGGNDIGFADLITDCIDLQVTSWKQIRHGPDGCAVTQQELERRVESLLAGVPTVPAGWRYGPNDTPQTLANFYRSFATDRLRPGGVLVVVGYPRLLAPSKDWPAWRGGMCQRVWDFDADTLGNVTDYLDTKLKDAVAQAGANLPDGRSIRYVSRLDQFDADGGHSLCSPTGSEWLNGISLGTSSDIRPAHSFHPNERGHQGTAELVAREVESALAPAAAPAPQTTSPARPGSTPPLAPPTTSPPPLRDPAPRFEIGSPFDAKCINAWPTAPSYTPTTITLTTTCTGVSKQFLFVQVIYDDPDLPITPNTGQFRVRGRIVNTARSAYGYSTLIVQADRIDIL